jgi:predicted transcriptional regulator
MAKRNKLEIMKDILEIVKDNNHIKPTPLLRKSNLSSTNFKLYFNDLSKKQFIQEINIKDEKFIKLTEEGFRFLEKYKNIIDFINEFGL